MTATAETQAPDTAYEQPAERNAELENEKREALDQLDDAARKGRAEALAIIMELDAEEGLDDYITSHPIGETGEYGSAWDLEKLAALLRTDDSVWSLRCKAEGEHYHHMGLRQEFEAYREQYDAQVAAEAISKWSATIIRLMEDAAAKHDADSNYPPISLQMIRELCCDMDEDADRLRRHGGIAQAPKETAA